MVNVRVLEIALDTAREREKIVERGVRVLEVDVREMTSDNRLRLHLGGGPGIPLQPGDNFAWDDEQAQAEGLFVTVPTAQPGVTVTLLVLDGARSTGAAARVRA